MNKCETCGSEIKPTKPFCSVCEYRRIQEKLVPISIKNYDYYVVLDALEFAYQNFKDGEKQSEFREVLYCWRRLSENFQSCDGTL